jgi:transposase, IS200 family
MAVEYTSLAHTKHYTRYHIILTPKYRRKAIYAGVRANIRDIIKPQCIKE